MENYLEGICIFICLGDLLGHFLPSKKYEKLYRYSLGILVLLLIVQPFGKSVAKALGTGTDDFAKLFEERISGQNGLWDAESSEETLQEETDKILEGCLGRMSESQMQDELEERGYELPGEEE